MPSHQQQGRCGPAAIHNPPEPLGLAPSRAWKGWATTSCGGWRRRSWTPRTSAALRPRPRQLFDRWMPLRPRATGQGEESWLARGWRRLGVAASGHSDRLLLCLCVSVAGVSAGGRTCTAGAGVGWCHACHRKFPGAAGCSSSRRAGSTSPRDRAGSCSWVRAPPPLPAMPLCLLAFVTRSLPFALDVNLGCGCRRRE